MRDKIYIQNEIDIFDTIAPSTSRPSVRRSDEQGETARYGTTIEHMTVRETGTIDRTICDAIDGTINLEWRHGTGISGDKSDVEAVYH